MSLRDNLKHPIIASVIAGVILSPLALFSDVVRAGVAAFFVGLWNGICAVGAGIWNLICAVGRWLATPVVVPLWLILASVIAFLVCFKVARVFRARALAAEDRPGSVPAASQGAPQRPEAQVPEFRLTAAQQRIIALLAQVHPGSQNLVDLHYASRLQTQAHTEREAEGLEAAGIIESGSNYVTGTWYALTREGRDYALDNGMFPGGR